LWDKGSFMFRHNRNRAVPDLPAVHISLYISCRVHAETVNWHDNDFARLRGRVTGSGGGFLFGRDNGGDGRQLGQFLGLVVDQNMGIKIRRQLWI
jgi:hypothetical protein